jgi:hypothetical protein
MIFVQLNNELSFAIEHCEKQARLIVYKNGLEDVCRKETFGNLRRFIAENNCHLFKGRLQLNKHGECIGIEVKGKLVGNIKAEEFLSYLEKLINLYSITSVMSN